MRRGLRSWFSDNISLAVHICAMEAAGSTKTSHHLSLKRTTSTACKDFSIVMLGQGGVGKSGRLVMANT